MDLNVRLAWTSSCEEYLHDSGRDVDIGLFGRLLGLEAIAIGRLVAARMLLARASEVLLVDCRRDHIDCRLKFAIVQSTKGDIVSTPSSL